MSDKTCTNRKKTTPKSSLKMKRHKASDCMNNDTTSKENNYSTDSPGVSTPEATRPQQTSEISWLNSKVGYDLSPSNSINLTVDEACKDQPNLNRKSPNESKTYNKAALLGNEEVNSNELLAATMKSEVPTWIEYPVGNSLNTECELDSHISHSQFDSIENNPFPTPASERELMHECTFPRELAHKLNTTKKFAEDVTNYNFSSVYPTASVFKMPRINWVHQQENTQVLKFEDIEPETTQLQEISPLYSEEFNSLAESSFNNDDYHVNNTLGLLSFHQHQVLYNGHQPMTYLEFPIYEIGMTNATFDLNELKTKESDVQDINGSEEIIKNKNSDSKSEEHSTNEQENILYFQASTPEFARPPPSPSHIISFLNSTVQSDLPPCNSNNLTANEPCEEPLDLRKMSPNESNTYEEKCEKVNFSEPLAMSKSEVSALSMYPAAYYFSTEPELESNILHSQQNYIENKSQENCPNEQENIPYFQARTPEFARPPPSVSPIVISFLNSTVESDLPPCNSNNLAANEPCEEPLDLSKMSPNESNTYKVKCEKVNSSELLVMTKSEVSTLTTYPAVNYFSTEPELESNILLSQHNYIENNHSISATPKMLPLKLNSREIAEVVQNFNNIPILPISLTPNLPRIYWVRKLQRDRRQLEVIFHEISQLNIMIGRAICDIWTNRKEN